MRPLVTQWIRLRTGNEQQAAPLVFHKIPQIVQHQGAQIGQAEISQQDHVVLQQLALLNGKMRLGSQIFRGILGIGILQHCRQLDRLFTLEKVLQIAELIPRSVVRQQHPDLLFADGNVPGFLVVIEAEFLRLRTDFQDQIEFTDFGGSERDLQTQRCLVVRHGDRLLLQHLVGTGLLQFHLNRLPRKTRRFQFRRHSDGVIDEGDFIHQRVKQGQIAQRFIVANSDRIEGHTSCPGISGRR